MIHYGFGIHYVLLGLGSMVSVLDYGVRALGNLSLQWTELGCYVYLYYRQDPYSTLGTVDGYCSINLALGKEKEEEWVLLCLMYA